FCGPFRDPAVAVDLADETNLVRLARGGRSVTRRALVIPLPRGPGYHKGRPPQAPFRPDPMAGLHTAPPAAGGRPPAPMHRRDDALRELLFGLLALHNDFIGQTALATAFHDPAGRPVSDALVGGGALTAPQRALLEALTTAHLDCHGGDTAR